jgi:hypothetical protein
MAVPVSRDLMAGIRNRLDEGRKTFGYMARYEHCRGDSERFKEFEEAISLLFHKITVRTSLAGGNVQIIGKVVDIEAQGVHCGMINCPREGTLSRASPMNGLRRCFHL